jgi:hypothetical protein
MADIPDPVITPPSPKKDLPQPFAAGDPALGPGYDNYRSNPRRPVSAMTGAIRAAEATQDIAKGQAGHAQRLAGKVPK